MKEEEFTKLTKKQKLRIPPSNSWMQVKCSEVLFIPIGEKNDGYGMSACFIKAENGWVRVANYDCFRFLEVKTRLRGDFEHGGIRFFWADFLYDYGLEFTQI